ncbi:MAG: 4-hydroxy-tetrahydrodipicolinate synthase [Coriobacteriia bacterium]|nr:4-hydroxy-tetrahydrodipicolinate synthase [Coriobacteriia bacterium]MBN2840034.1 4-hydroxy-tetrahydrodipicolinate synthase [Coriobacteriia bacterium]
MTEPRFGRLLTAMVTPFTAEGELDLPRAQELALRLLDQGTEALVVCGTTGESPTVYYDDKMRLFSAVLEAVDGAAPVVANAGDNCTDDSVAFARRVVELGVDAVMAVVPYYNKPPQEGLYRHFGAIANAVDVPVILYNIPGRSVVNLEAVTTLRLAADFENIVAVKEASSNLTQIASIIDGSPLGFEVLSGNDEDTLPMMGLGATGVISVASHVAGPQLAEMLSAQATGDHTRALKIHLELMPLFKALFMTANPIMVKKALGLTGFAVGECRLPLIPATEAQTAELAEIMRHSGLITD